MKTHVIKLEPHDDSISTRDKMGWGHAGRVLLIWPERGRILTRRLDLLLIQRYSNRLGAQLALVTRDSEVIDHARDLGIPTFKSLKKAEKGAWRLPHRFRQEAPLTSRSGRILEERSPDRQRLEEMRPTPPKNLPPALRLLVFAVGVLAMLSIAAVLLPSAQLTLAPDTIRQEVEIPVQASPEFETIKIAGQVPAVKRKIEVEGRAERPTSGQVEMPQAPASGRVTFTNLTDSRQHIPVGTVVTALNRSAAGNSQRFQTTQGGDLPAGLEQEVSLPIEALTPGEAGNLPARAITAIEGLLGPYMTVTNHLPTRGGTQLASPAPTEEDRQALHAMLADSLQNSARDELQAQLQPGDILVDSSFHLVEVLEESYLPTGQQPSNQLSLNLRLSFEALVITADDLRALGSAVLEANLPDSFQAVPGTFEVQTTDEPRPVADGIQMTITAQQQIEAVLPAAQAVRLALGQPPQGARQRLQAALPLRQPPQIAMAPAWWPRLPVIPFRIEVTEATPATLSAP